MPAPVVEAEPVVIQPAPLAEEESVTERESAAAEQSTTSEAASARTPSAETSSAEAAPSAAPEPAAATPAASAPAPDMQIAPVALPAEAPVVPAEPAAQADGAATADPSSWALIGGAGAVFLLGAGFYAFSRRRRDETAGETAAVSANETVMTPRPTVTVAHKPVSAEANPLSAPATVRRADPMASPASRERFGDLEAIVAAPVSRDNPFATRRNRLRRAHFIQRHGHAPMTLPATQPLAPAVASSPAASQTVYSFGRPGGTRPGRKPATT